MKRTGFVFSGLLMIVCVLATHVATLQGGVVITGDVTPPLPWSSQTKAVIGETTHGTLRVDAGSLLSTGNAILGNYWLGVGDATVAGSGSNWTLYHLVVGNGGKGTLTVDAGGEVSTSYCGIGHWSDGLGAARVSGMRSKLTVGGGSRWAAEAWERLTSKPEAMCRA